MTIRLRGVDAFTDTPFNGNPAAVLLLDEMPSDGWLAAVARETNVPDTAFVVRRRSADADFDLRWFTPSAEVDLCGHATLAAAHCLFDDGMAAPIRFATRSGLLTVSQRKDGAIVMDFPSNPPAPVEQPAALEAALGARPLWTGLSPDRFFLLALFEREDDVHGLTPNMSELQTLEPRAFIATARAEADAGHDFVTRLFAPRIGIPEDPVTGSSHTVLAPFWASRLGKTALRSLQASHRPGHLDLELEADRVLIAGRAVIIYEGTLSESAAPENQ